MKKYLFDIIVIGVGLIILLMVLVYQSYQHYLARPTIGYQSYWQISQVRPELTSAWYCQTAEVTAYSAWETCPDNNCIMASGHKAYMGAVACPRYLPLGTSIKISKIDYTCEDRTAQWADGRFDIFWGYGYPAWRQAIQFGIKKLEVCIKYQPNGKNI